MDEIDSLFQWDVDVARLPEMRDRLRGRREYPAAARRLAANLLRDADIDSSLSGMLRDAGRTVAALSAFWLHATGDVTLPRLKAFIAGFGLVSPGRARALLNYMLHLGYLEPDPVQSGARATLYRATPQFLASYGRHQASLIEAVCVIEPAADFVLRNLANRDVIRALVIEQGKAFAAGSSQTAEHAAWYGVFMHRLAGIQIVHSLVAEAPSFPPEARIRFPIAESARRFDVSSKHLKRIMKDAADQGFVELEPGALRFTVSGRNALDWLYASRLCVHLACAARALKAMPQLRAGLAA